MTAWTRLNLRSRPTRRRRVGIGGATGLSGNAGFGRTPFGQGPFGQ